MDLMDESGILSVAGLASRSAAQRSRAEPSEAEQSEAEPRKVKGSGTSNKVRVDRNQIEVEIRTARATGAQYGR